MIICNPVSGSGEGKTIYDLVVQPMFQHAGLAEQVIMTEYANHGFELGESFDMEEYKYIFFISGDGLMHETIQGWANRYRTKQDMLRFLEARVIGHIPAGTSNSLPCSLEKDISRTTNINPVSFVERMLSNIANGMHLDVDLYTVSSLQNATSQTAKNFIWDVVMSSWGIVADVDFSVEGPLRCAPRCCRTTLAALWTIMKFNCYDGVIKFKLAQNHNSPIEPSDTTLLERDGDYFCIQGPFAHVAISPLNWVASDFSVNPGKTTDACGWLGLSVVVAEGVGRCSLISYMGKFEDGTQHENKDILHFPVTRVVISKEAGLLNTCGTVAGSVGGDPYDPESDVVIETVGRLNLL